MKGGENKMKKTLILAVMIVACMALTSGYALAISGVCSNCHTMHNSQNGVPMNFDASATPNPVLLRGTCLACHAQAVANTIDPTSNAPQVNVTGYPTALAGGTFYNGNAGAGGTGLAHNPYGASNTVFTQELTLLVPPGDSTAGAVTNANLSCAGTTGCHGDRTVAGTGAGGNDLSALSGAHHGNNGTGGAITATTTIGNSYRFLNGIYGFEETSWENAPSSTVHNQYYAVDGLAGDGHTISNLCSQCHGVFHGAANVVAGGEWVRHPTDHIIPDSGEYASAFGGSGAGTPGTYNPEVPVGSATVTAIKSTVTVGTDMVVCVSCHRAHGSDQPDLLRWNYGNMVANTTGAGAGTGCFRCHTQKDGI